MVLALTEKKPRWRGRHVQCGKKSKREMVLAVTDTGDKDRGDWILDSNASRHLVNDETLLIDSSVCSQEIAMDDGESLHLTRVGSVRLGVIASSVESMVTRNWQGTLSHMENSR